MNTIEVVERYVDNYSDLDTIKWEVRKHLEEIRENVNHAITWAGNAIDRGEAEDLLFALHDLQNDLLISSAMGGLPAHVARNTFRLVLRPQGEVNDD